MWTSFLGLCLWEPGQIQFCTPSKLFSLLLPPLQTRQLDVEVTSIVCHCDRCSVDDRKLCLCISCGYLLLPPDEQADICYVQYTITHWGDLAYLQNQYWFDPLFLFATGAVAALAKSSLAARYWLLTRNKFITLTLFCLITVATGGAFACGVTIAIFPEYTNRRKVIIPGTCVVISSENLAHHRSRDGHFNCVGSSRREDLVQFDRGEGPCSHRSHMSRHSLEETFNY
ncbi:hypothetical protein B0H14DRAFT_3164083 [Mycena olivaceomarginata]|nr:hypothetical protein B0H14DRAFT_3164083 [Mycena olivaceomarginata]